MGSFDNILVICIGNICRSPMAAAILMYSYPDKCIESAGLSALVGHPADTKAVESMDTYNLDIRLHIAKQVDEKLVNYADLILTMSASQTKWIENRWPHCRGKTFRIGHWLDRDIEDPYQHEKSKFDTSRQDIMNSLELWNERISEATPVRGLKLG